MSGKTEITPEHACKNSFRLLKIFEELWPGKTHSPQLGRRRKKNSWNTFTRKSSKSQLLLWGQTDYAIRSPIYELSEFLLVFFSYNCAIRTETLFFSRLRYSDLSRSPKVELTTPSDPRPMSPYKRSIVAIALSRTEIVFFSRWPWSDLSRSPKIKLITPSVSRPVSWC